jgi:hypothetical protein
MRSERFDPFEKIEIRDRETGLFSFIEVMRKRAACIHLPEGSMCAGGIRS